MAFPSSYFSVQIADSFGFDFGGDEVARFRHEGDAYAYGKGLSSREHAPLAARVTSYTPKAGHRVLYRLTPPAPVAAAEAAPIDEVIYAPAIIKMAETKRQHVNGATLRQLDELIAAARQLDDQAGRFSPIPSAGDLRRSAFERACDNADQAARALRRFANPL